MREKRSATSKIPVFTSCLCLQVRVDCCQRLLPLIIHSVLMDDVNGSWRQLLSSHIQDFFSFCSRSAQASSRTATPLNSDSGKTESIGDHISTQPLFLIASILIDSNENRA